MWSSRLFEHASCISYHNTPISQPQHEYRQAGPSTSTNSKSSLSFNRSLEVSSENLVSQRQQSKLAPKSEASDQLHKKLVPKKSKLIIVGIRRAQIDW